MILEQTIVTQIPLEDQLRNGERERIHEATAIEREWWPIEKKYLDPDTAAVAVSRGELTVVPKQGDGWCLIGRLNGEKEGEPNTIRPIAFQLLNDIIREWQKKIGFNEGISAAITSLYRSMLLQAKLDRNLAMPGTQSSHLAGTAIDLSLRSYYLREGDTHIPVNSWADEHRQYSPHHAIQLINTATIFQARGCCNVVVENIVLDGRLIPSVLHICVNPEYRGTNFTNISPNEL